MVALDWTRVKLGIIGGDRRELAVADILVARGAEVKAVCLPWPDDVSWVTNRLEDVVEWANVVLTPVGGTDEFGQVSYTIVNGTQPPPRLTDAILRRIAPGTVLCIGIARPFLRDAARRYGLRLNEFRERDDFAIRNAVPTAEGALQLAMEDSAVTIFGSDAVVVGYGRAGSALGDRLHLLGARVTVVARSSADRARAMSRAMTAVEFAELGAAAQRADLLFNTVPALVVTEPVLAGTQPEVTIVDLASAPGGVDFVAAKQLGRSARLAPGLPGIVAPKSAGRIVADIIETILVEEENRGGLHGP